MDEYIRREAVLEIVNMFDRTTALVIGRKVVNLPAADVAPVVRGRWELIPGTKTRQHCSCCYMSGPEYIKFYSFCPNCGARMER